MVWPVTLLNVLLFASSALLPTPKVLYPYFFSAGSYVSPFINIILARYPPNVLLGLKAISVCEGPGSSPTFFLMKGISFFSSPVGGKLGRLTGVLLIEST